MALAVRPGDLTIGLFSPGAQEPAGENLTHLRRSPLANVYPGLTGLLLNGRERIPLLAITARRGGCVIKNYREATEAGADGVVFHSSVGKPPRPRFLRMLRSVFWIARPPLLALMQGGEFALALRATRPGARGTEYRRSAAQFCCASRVIWNYLDPITP